MNEVHSDIQGKARTTLSVYSLSPLRVKGVLFMRSLEGFRVKRYAQNTQYRDKMTIQLTLPSDFNITIHYELSFVSSSETAMVGSAHIKIGLSGDHDVVQLVRNDFVSHQTYTQHRLQRSVLSKTSCGICQLLRWIRKEDCLESYLCPLEGAAIEKSCFFRRLETLTAQQHHRHFSTGSFEVLLTCEYPLDLSQQTLAELATTNHGENSLHAAMEAWAAKIIAEGIYIKCFPTSKNLPSYCFAKVTGCSRGSRHFSVKIGSLGLDPNEHVRVMKSLKCYLNAVDNIVVLPKQLSGILMLNKNQEKGSRLTEQLCRHERWLLLKDPELLPLLIRRRLELGNFWLADSSTSQIIFVKFISQKLLQSSTKTSTVALHCRETESDLLLVQYQVEIRPENLIVDLRMETESGYFVPLVWTARGTYCGNSQEDVSLFDQYVQESSAETNNVAELYGVEADCLACFGCVPEILISLKSSRIKSVMLRR